MGASTVILMERISVRILKYPHPTLRHKCKEITKVDRPLREMIEQMLEAMYEGDGIGLAATQVDLPYRVFVMNTEGDPQAVEQEHVFINPVITARKGACEREEGCLSFPGIYANVIRPEKIVLNAYTLQGAEVTYEMDGLPARAAQHEIDHLDGILFIDRLSPAGLLAIKQPLSELEQQFQTDRRLGLIPADREIASRLAELEGSRT
jgi:peptide deformylase